MKFASLISVVLIGIVVVLVGAAMAIALGGPGSPPAMASINDPFKSVDFSDLPALQYYAAQDKTILAYRYYEPAASDAGTGQRAGPGMQAGASGSVVLIHGSSASSASMHLLARAFSEAGYAAYALDIRGHGESGTRGRIAYIGQLDDDLDAFMRAIEPRRPVTLAGFSAGGGFALRYAGGPHQEQFDNYLLLAPFLSQDSPTYRPGSGGWVEVGMGRVVGLSLLNRLGISAFNDLPVTRFALNERAKEFLTEQYSFSLAANFRPRADYQANMRAVRRPVSIVAGAADEAFHTDLLASEVRSQGQDWPVHLLPGIGHIPLTLDAVAVGAAVAAVEAMNKP